MRSNRSITSTARPSAHPSARHRLGRPRSLGVVAALGLMSLAACGGSDGKADGIASVSDVGTDEATDSTTDGTTSGTSDADTDPELVIAEYNDCMEKFGFDEMMGEAGSSGNVVATMEIQEVDGPDADSSGEDLQAALEECEPILQQADMSFDMSPEEEAATADFEAALQNCLADKGFDIDIGGQGGNVVGDSDDETLPTLPADMDFDALNEAFAECQEEVPLPAELGDAENDADADAEATG